MKAKYIINLLILLSGLTFQAHAQVEKSKVVNETVNLTPQGKVSVNHRRGPLHIRTSADGKTTLSATIKVSGDDPADVQKALDNINLNIEAAGDYLNVRSGDNIKNWITTFNRSKITFVNGTIISGIKDIHIELVLNVPKTVALDLTNKYDNIYLAERSGDVKVDLYDADLYAESCNTMQLKLKYGKGYLKNIQHATLDIYDSHLDIKQAQQVDANIKYSKLNWGNVQKLNLQSYDSKYIIGNISADSRIEDKYSEFTLGDVQQLTLNLYDADLNLGHASHINLNAKYTHLIGKNVGKIHLNESYDNEIELQDVQELSTISKYTKYIIRSVNQTLAMDTYDDEFNIQELGSNFGNLTINGKYLKFQSTLNSGASFHLIAKTKYGQLNYPETRADVRIHKEKNDDLELEAMVGSNVQGRKANITCHDCKISF